MDSEPTTTLSGLATWSGDPARQLGAAVLLRAIRDMQQRPRKATEVWRWLHGAQAANLFDALDIDRGAALAALQGQMEAADGQDNQDRIL